ncbi:MAG: hypothetical protein AAF211_31895, partial [Myxococcota bacterium]
MHVAWLLGGAGAVMYALEVGWPRRATRPHVSWRLRALALSLVQIAVAYLGGVVLDPWLQGLRLWSAEELGLVGGTVWGYLGVTLLWYWWHRARHEVPFL